VGSCSRDCDRDSRPDAPQQDSRPYCSRDCNRDCSRDCSRDCGLVPRVHARKAAGKHAKKAAGKHAKKAAGSNAPSYFGSMCRRASAWLLRTTCPRWRPAAWLHASATQAQASRAKCHSTCLIRKGSSRAHSHVRPHSHLVRATGVHGPGGTAWAAWAAAGVLRGRVEVAAVWEEAGDGSEAVGSRDSKCERQRPERPSEAIRGHQKPSEVIRGRHQTWSSLRSSSL
jgi:hypothetical protein